MMDAFNNPTSGPSRSHRQTSPHRREPSWEFGEFAAAPSQQAASSALDTGDLLGSFEDLSHSDKPTSSSSSSIPTDRIPFADQGPGAAPNLLDDEGWNQFFAQQQERQPEQHTRPPEPVRPMVIDLPPRPSEMPADYIPPARPRRMSQKRLSFSGPSSPPLVSHVGADITFRPTPESQRTPSTSGGETQNQHARYFGTAPRRSPPPSHSPTQSKLMHTLATTTKLASKWKTVLDPSMFHPPSNHQQHPARASTMPSLTDTEQPARYTAEPIEVTHTTPFATAEQIAGSYTAPGGAPAFNGDMKSGEKRTASHADWPETKLVGRRLGTSELLTPHLADSLRQALPPRQRLSSSWSLLFSLDQHGASLSTMYRLIDKYAGLHRGAGNLLIVRDGGDRLFGVYLNENIQRKEGTYYGSGESFMFKFLPGSAEPTIFRWTGRNQYYALCETGFASFGGGGASYGLILDSKFSRNSSATSPAYNNEVLCAGQGVYSESAEYFECLGVEVWGTQV